MHPVINASPVTLRPRQGQVSVAQSDLSLPFSLQLEFCLEANNGLQEMKRACWEPEEGSINITSAGVNETLGRVPKMGRRSLTGEAP